MFGYYAGIGSRETPQEALELMEEIGKCYAQAGWILRSGGASGADMAFEDGAGDKSEIYKANIKDKVSPIIYEKARNIAGNLHPAWGSMPEYAQQLHTRNVFQILGKDLSTPVTVVICWTPDKCIKHEDRTRLTGGTGTGISVADMANIPILNMARPDHFWRASLITKRV